MSLPEVTAPTGPRWVWVSSEASRAAGAVSILAVVETLLCVALYWGVFAWLGQSWQLWLVLLSAPLVLFRSDASVARSKRAYDHFGDTVFDAQDDAATNIRVYVLGFSSIALCVWFVPEHLDFFAWHGSGWVFAAALGMLLPLIIEVTVFRISRLSFPYAILASLVLAGMIGYVLFAPFGLGVLAAVLSLPFGATLIVLLALGLGIFLRMFWIRLFSVCCHLRMGLAQIASNWRKLMWVHDPMESPSFLPGVKETRVRDFLGNGSFFTSTPGWLLNITWNGIFLLLLFAPTYIWRWTIKSTAWFYLPLLWLGWGWVNLRGDDLEVWGKSYSTILLNWCGALLAAAFLFGSAVALFLPATYFDLRATLASTGAPMTPLGWALVLDWQAFRAQPWQWFYAPSWILALTIFFNLDIWRKQVAAGAAVGPRLGRLRVWMWLSNLRYVLTNTGLLVALYAFLTAMGAWQDLAALIGRTPA